MLETTSNSIEYFRLALVALAHYHGAWWRFLRQSSSESKASDDFGPSDALDAFSNVFPSFMFKDMVEKTFKSVAALLKNRGESEDLIRRIRVYGKERAVGILAQAQGNPEKDKSKSDDISLFLLDVFPLYLLLWLLNLQLSLLHAVSSAVAVAVIAGL